MLLGLEVMLGSFNTVGRTAIYQHANVSFCFTADKHTV